MQAQTPCSDTRRGGWCAVDSLRLGRCGGELVWGVAGTGGSGGVPEANSAEAPKRRHMVPPLSLADGAAPRLVSFCSEVSSSSRLGGSTGLSTALNTAFTPSGFVPGVKLVAVASRSPMASVERDLIAFQNSMRGPFCNVQGLYCNFPFLLSPGCNFTHRFE